MFIGKLHRSNVVLLAGLFFAATGIGFAFHRELQYALVSLIIASIIDLFVGGFMNQFQSSVAEAAFAKELKTLSSFLIYGVLPGVYLMAVTNAGAFSLAVAFVYKLKIPRLPSQWLFYMVGVQVVLCILWVFLGNFITG